MWIIIIVETSYSSSVTQSRTILIKCISIVIKIIDIIPIYWSTLSLSLVYLTIVSTVIIIVWVSIITGFLSTWVISCSIPTIVFRSWTAVWTSSIRTTTSPCPLMRATIIIETCYRSFITESCTVLIEGISIVIKIIDMVSIYWSTLSIGSTSYTFTTRVTGVPITTLSLTWSITLFCLPTITITWCIYISISTISHIIVSTLCMRVYSIGTRNCISEIIVNFKIVCRRNSISISLHQCMSTITRHVPRSYITIRSCWQWRTHIPTLNLMDITISISIAIPKIIRGLMSHSKVKKLITWCLCYSWSQQSQKRYNR